MERDIYKQTKLTKTLDFTLKTVSKCKAAANFTKNLSQKKSCNKSVKVYFYYSTQKHDDSIVNKLSRF